MTMAMEPLESEPEVKIHEPDKSLLHKIGAHNLDRIFSPEVIQSAEKIIQDSADIFVDDSLKQMQQLEGAFEVLRKAPEAKILPLQTIIDRSFSVKSQAGLSGYPLVAAVARSLQLFAEQLLVTALTVRDMAVIQWHCATITQLLSARMKDEGGAVGEAIKAEMEKVTQRS
jgi:HPt (histidine-containing phosphotransfer) domain-containing protein